jgi:hypothetical protein
LRKGPLQILLAVSVAVTAAACGKKGPPLAPFSNLPAAVTDLTARQVGSELVFQFTVPAANTDGRKPADLDRVELYVLTSRQRVPSDYVRQGRLAGSVKVRRPPPPEEESPSAAPVEPGAEQGAPATIRALPDFFVPPVLRLPAAAAGQVVLAPLFPDGSGPSPASPQSTPATRLFVVAGVNRSGRTGAPSPVLEVPIVTAPGAPDDVQVSYTEREFIVSWTASPLSTRRPIQEAAPRNGALPSRPHVTFASSGGYNVYEVARPVAGAEEPAAAEPVPMPLNRSPLTETRFEDARVEFGVERCFLVRTRETLGTLAIESAGSPVVCVAPVDTFAPMPPRNLIGVATDGAVNLLWDPNTESDLAGYLVLRGEAPGEKLQALTAAPIAETTYRDTTVQSGVAYVYVVVAVDKAGNYSAQSNRFERKP